MEYVKETINMHIIVYKRSKPIHTFNIKILLGDVLEGKYTKQQSQETCRQNMTNDDKVIQKCINKHCLPMSCKHPGSLLYLIL